LDAHTNVAGEIKQAAPELLLSDSVPNEITKAAAKTEEQRILLDLNLARARVAQDSRRPNPHGHLPGLDKKAMGTTAWSFTSCTGWAELVVH
jgi:hypothetical protein